MNETIFGSGTPVWTAMPSIGLAYQPMSVSNRPIAPPLFSSTAIPGGIGGTLTGAGLSAQQNLGGSGYVAPYPFAPNPAAALPGYDANGWVTATSVLTAVAQRRGVPWRANVTIALRIGSSVSPSVTTPEIVPLAGGG